MATITEPKAKEIDGIIYFDTPWDVSEKDWFSLHDESDFIADNLDNDKVRIYCYAKNGAYNGALERIAKTMYPQKVIYHGMGVSFGGIWL